MDDLSPSVYRSADIIARRVQRRAWHPGADLSEDARQEALLAAVVATRRVDKSKSTGVLFVRKRMEGAVADFFKREDHLSRSHRRKVKSGQADNLRNVSIGYAVHLPDRCSDFTPGIDVRSDVASLYRYLTLGQRRTVWALLHTENGSEAAALLGVTTKTFHSRVHAITLYLRSVVFQHAA